MDSKLEAAFEMAIKVKEFLGVSSFKVTLLVGFAEFVFSVSNVDIDSKLIELVGSHRLFIFADDGRVNIRIDVDLD